MVRSMKTIRQGTKKTEKKLSESPSSYPSEPIQRMREYGGERGALISSTSTAAAVVQFHGCSFTVEKRSAPCVTDDKSGRRTANTNVFERESFFTDV
nr:hypothetical protein HmN_000999900 [Hymenolepis microstoma]